MPPWHNTLIFLSDRWVNTWTHCSLGSQVTWCLPSHTRCGVLQLIQQRRDCARVWLNFFFQVNCPDADAVLMVTEQRANSGCMRFLICRHQEWFFPRSCSCCCRQPLAACMGLGSAPMNVFTGWQPRRCWWVSFNVKQMSIFKANVIINISIHITRVAT